jgi:DNA sulfur modification protein DndE
MVFVADRNRTSRSLGLCVSAVNTREHPMIRSTWPVVLLAVMMVALILPGEPVIFLAGDSTMADKPVEGNPERGWGQLFPAFVREGVRVENHARNGRSTKSFLAQGLWDSLCSRMHPGDYVLIEFGHNDGKRTDSNRYTPAQTGYRQNLTRFVKDVRERGGIPVLLTPIARRKFDEAGGLVDTHGDYPVVMREVAAAEQVPLIDMQRMSSDLLVSLGPDASKELYLWVSPGVYPALPEGKKDDTHFVEAGARTMAGLVVRGIRELDLPLAALLRPEPPPSPKEDEKQ